MTFGRFASLCRRLEQGMPNGLTVSYFRERARYWRQRARREIDPEKQTEFRERAAILDHEANLLRKEKIQKQKAKRRPS